MNNAEMKVVKFDNSDVIATSTEPMKYTFSGFYDGIPENGKINLMTKADFKKYMINNGMITNDVNINTINAIAVNSAGKSIKVAFNSLFNTNKNGDCNTANSEYEEMFNGTFIWNGTSFTKQ